MVEPRYITKALREMYPDTEWAVEDGDLSNIIIISGPPITSSPSEIELYAQTIIQNEIDNELIVEQNKQSALAKLSILGLTEQEAKALFGI